MFAHSDPNATQCYSNVIPMWQFDGETLAEAAAAAEEPVAA